jgi:hypothetical protein
VIENIDRLYEIATSEKSSATTMAFQYEKALERGLSEAQRNEIQCLPETLDHVVPVGALWYKLQLAARRLWEIPFGEEPVVLNPKASVGKNDADDALSALHRDRPLVVTVAGNDDAAEPHRYFLHKEESDILDLFTEPVVIGEALFEKKEIADFEDARDFLAECLRKSVLIPAET